jgi:hypothetical protein
MAVRELETPRQRIAGLKLLVETEPAAALPILRGAFDGEGDGEVRMWELRLIGLCRDKEDVDRVSACLSDRDAGVRAAAADALGLIHCPAYAVPQHHDPDIAVLASDPPMDVEPLFEKLIFKGKLTPAVQSTRPLPSDAIELPESLRTALETMMLQGATSGERIAAARALVAWPPAHYRLRVAEWGVWVNDSGDLKLVQSVIDEIPKFVHRTGNTAESLGDRIRFESRWPSFITKPILHAIADRPLAADVQVLMTKGRPWFAFPRPDDFTLSVADSVPYRSSTAVNDRLPNTDRSDKAAELCPTAEGYPWLAPPNRSYTVYYYGTFGGVRQQYQQPSDAISSLGLRWQSLIISPERQQWMTPPPVTPGSRCAWWERLRKVPSSWLSSQGESERFLYYDGPTRLSSPIEVHIGGDILRLTHLPIGGSAADQPQRPRARGELPNSRDFLAQGSEASRDRLQGLYIDADGAQTMVKILAPLSSDENVVDIAQIAPITVDTARNRFLAILTDYGLTAEEAAGLVDVWKQQFFDTPGKRLLVILPARDYDGMCPLRVRPRPTELVRLAIVLTEFCGRRVGRAER